VSKKRTTDSNGSTRKRKIFHLKDLQSISPQTETQEKLWDLWIDDPDKSFFVYGPAGTGKTYLALYLAIADILEANNGYDKLYIIRSTVPSRDLGYLPGDLQEKINVYESPYIQIFDSFFPYKKSYDNLKEKGMIEFLPTAYLRGTTFDNAIIFVDEVQNMSFTEVDTIMTRVGKNSKIVFCGDKQQTDMLAKRENGFNSFLSIIKQMAFFFSVIKFRSDDVVRSGMVKEYLKTKDKIYK
jgi:phosphate starvation-inducible protein PhoH